jgi:hypothetical protein
MLKTLTMTALLLAFCCPAFAGEMLTPPAPQPPSVAAQEPLTTDEDAGAADTLTQAVLTLLVSALT